MRFLLQFALLIIAYPCFAHDDIRWPDASIPVPTEVEAFIVDECVRYQGYSEETVEACVRGESYGYRAVVMMLLDPVFGDRAAARYLGCAAGLSDYGGRFHRRKAECISTAYKIVWRFEFSQKAEFGDRNFASRDFEDAKALYAAARSPG